MKAGPSCATPGFIWADATAFFQEGANAGRGIGYMGVRTSDETNNDTQKRFRSQNYSDTTKSPTATVIYQTNPKFDQVCQKMPEVPYQECIDSIFEGANTDGLPVDTVADQLLAEINTNSATAEVEAQGGSAGQLKLTPPMNRGDLFYTPSTTAYADHGHIGMFSQLVQITESIPATGVHTIGYLDRNVDKNAVQEYPTNTNVMDRGVAATWTYGPTAKSTRTTSRAIGKPAVTETRTAPS